MGNLTFLKNLTDLQRRMDLNICHEIFGNHLGRHIWTTHFHFNDHMAFKLEKFDLESQKLLVEYIEKHPTI